MSKPEILEKIDNIEEDLADITINVKNFGVVGDGTDETSKINNMISLLNPYVTILFPNPESYYNITSITLKEGQKIIGNKNTLFKLPSGNNKNPMFILGNNCEISNIKIDMNKDNQTVDSGHDYGYSAIDIKGNNCKITKNEIYNIVEWCIINEGSYNLIEKNNIHDQNFAHNTTWGYMAVFSLSGSYNVFNKNLIENGGNCGIYITSYSDNAILTDNIIIHSEFIGVACGYGENIVFKHNIIYDSYDNGIDVQQGHKVIIDGNIIKNAGIRAIGNTTDGAGNGIFAGDDTGNNPCNIIDIINNIIDGTKGDSIVCYGGNYYTINNNNIINSKSNGICIENGPAGSSDGKTHYIKVTNNNSGLNLKNGIIINSIEHILVKNNIAYKNGNYGNYTNLTPSVSDIDSYSGIVILGSILCGKVLNNKSINNAVAGIAIIISNNSHRFECKDNTVGDNLSSDNNAQKYGIFFTRTLHTRFSDDTYNFEIMDNWALKNIVAKFQLDYNITEGHYTRNLSEMDYGITLDYTDLYINKGEISPPSKLYGSLISGQIYEAGVMHYFSNPSTYIGEVCTVAGNPATWKKFGAIQA